MYVYIHDCLCIYVLPTCVFIILFCVQGLDFINLMAEIWSRRKVPNDDLKTQMEAEWKRWINLLLNLIDITAPQADVHLKLFIKGKGVTKTFRKSIERTVSRVWTPL